jgi:hypothetical protein
MHLCVGDAFIELPGVQLVEVELPVSLTDAVTIPADWPEGTRIVAHVGAGVFRFSASANEITRCTKKICRIARTTCVSVTCPKKIIRSSHQSQDHERARSYRSRQSIGHRRQGDLTTHCDVAVWHLNVDRLGMAVLAKIKSRSANVTQGISSNATGRYNACNAGGSNRRSNTSWDYSVAPRMAPPRLRRLCRPRLRQEAQRRQGRSRHRIPHPRHPRENRMEQARP